MKSGASCKELTAPLCPGSALALSVVTADCDPPRAVAAQEAARYPRLDGDAALQSARRRRCLPAWT